jgi:RNA polymerase sigma-70 factor (ECF subfamily)
MNGAEAELVERYARGIAILLRHASKDPVLADDLQQETFRIVIEKIRKGEVREPEKLSGFVLAIARNVAIGYYRRAVRAEASDLEEAEQLADPSPGPLDELLRREQTAIARQVLNEMESARDREVLYRFYIAEEPKTQICTLLGLSGVHFNRILYRAKERYRVLYQEAMHRHRRKDERDRINSTS